MLQKIAQLDNDWGYSVSRGESLAAMVKVSSRGLIGKDRDDLLKRTSPEIVDQITKLAWLKGEVPTHHIGLGAGEWNSGNRNGDFFKEAVLQERHPTFVNHARYYRHHKSSDPAKSYGRIKLSFYNPRMHRVELLIGLNGDDETAKANEGLIADLELQKLAKGEDLGGSMGCLVSHDSCMGCGNKAKTKEQYCDEKMCKRGGCKHHLGKVCEDGFVLCVDNPDPLFNDYSHVFRPADRTAYGAAADYLAKTAGDAFVGGAELAERLGVLPPLDSVMPYLAEYDERVQDQVKLAYALTQFESVVSHANLPSAKAFAAANREPFPVHILGSGLKLAADLNWLADHRIVLHLDDYARLRKLEGLAKEASDQLPGIYTRLYARGDLADQVLAAGRSRTSVATPVLLAKEAGEYDLSPKSVQRRAMRASLRGILQGEKKRPATCEHKTAATQLAEEYALYKLAAIYRMTDRIDDDLMATMQNSVLQNYIE